jgi:hypothetical protein
MTQFIVAFSSFAKRPNHWHDILVHKILFDKKADAAEQMSVARSVICQTKKVTSLDASWGLSKQVEMFAG